LQLNDGSRDILTQWFEEYSDELYRYARFFLHSDVDAQDVVQEVFIRVGEHMQSFRNDSSVKTWIFRIARNYMIDVVNKERRKANVYKQIRDEVHTTMDTLVELEDVITCLQVPYRNVVLLRLVNGFNVEETSEILGWSSAKVRVTLHRAIRKLRKELNSFSKEGASDAIL
jgi:RNA polymerase sigma-70 factor (ECF subfamily)